MVETSEFAESILLCAKCGKELRPGTGDLYQVRIEAVADPFPQIIPDHDAATLKDDLKQTVAELRDVSAREAMDQVFRRLTIHFCIPCYRQWIEDPGR